MMLEIEPITNISLAALHARRKEIRAIIWKPSPRPPAIPRFKPRAINCIPHTSLPSLTQQPDQYIPSESDAPAPLPPPAPPRPATVRNIVAEVAAFHTITADHILSRTRKHGIVRPRQIACYLAKTLTKLSLSQIGKCIGGRDHTTVLHSIQKIEGLMVSNELLANQIDALRQRFIMPNPEILSPDDPTSAPADFNAEVEAEEQAEHAARQA
jgi:Bacterial dnaA protein helix-turn-helix